jgi:hypothetical protein
MVAPAKRKTQVFLSYSDADAGIARELGDTLADAGFDVFSADMTYPGDNTPLIVGRALASSDAMVVIVSPQSAKSSAVRRETQYAMGSLRYKNKLIPVIVRPTREMPWIFKRFGVIDAKKNRRKAGAEIVRRLRQAIEVGN